MKKEELSKWFWNKFYSCYPTVTEEPDSSIYYVYDPQFIRQLKLCRITGENIKLPSKISGTILFEQDLKNNYLWCDYYGIWSYFNENFSSKNDDIQAFIKNLLMEHDKLRQFTPSDALDYHSKGLIEHDKLRQFTPLKDYFRLYF